MSRTPVLASLAAAAALLLTACSGGGLGVFGGDSGGGDGERPQQLQPRPGIVLSANSTAQLGTVVIDGLGFTLYRFDEDRPNPPTSTCAGSCTQTWQPVLYSDPVVLEGVADNMVGKVARPDGQEQVTIGGWPVYRYLPDPQPGATDGHGNDGTWFAVTPDGKKATAS